MLQTTIEIIRSGLKADPSIPAQERNRILALLRSGDSQKTETAQTEPRILRRSDAARRLSCSLRTIDNLAASGALQKRKLPGRKRACGILESDLLALIGSGEKTPLT